MARGAIATAILAGPTQFMQPAGSSSEFPIGTFPSLPRQLFLLAESAVAHPSMQSPKSVRLRWTCALKIAVNWTKFEVKLLEVVRLGAEEENKKRADSS